MIGLDTLVDSVRREVPGCRRPLIIEALLWAAQDFCRRTHVWQRGVPDIEASTGCTAIFLTAEGACLCGPTSQSAASLSDTTIWKDNATLCDGTGLKEAVPVGARVVTVITDVDPACFSYEMGSAVLVISTSAAISGLKVALIPTEPSLPDYILDQWGDGIRTGALFKLFGQRGMSWSDQGAREQNRVERERYVLEAGASTAFNHVSGPAVVPRRGLPGSP